MSRFSMTTLVVALGLACAVASASGPVVFECEHARRLRGPSWVRREVGASQERCVELMGERARALVDVRVRRAADYIVWARARAASGGQAALSLRLEAEGGAEPLTGAIDGAAWVWVRLGTLRLGKPGWHALRLGATGHPRVDQLALSLEPGYEPSGVADSSATLRLAEPEIIRADDFMRTGREAGPWQVVSGEWKIQELKVRDDLGKSTGRTFDPTRSANAFSYIGTGTAEAPALAVTGYPVWRNYSFEAAVRSPRGRTFGLVLLRQDERNYYLFRCDLPHGTLEIVRCLDGITDRLASRRGDLRANQWYQLRFDACDGELSASIDGHTVLAAVDHTFLKGQPGIWSADEHGTYFDDVLIRNYRSVVERFNERTLVAWEALGDWRAAGRTVVGAGTLLCREAMGDFEASTSVRAEGRAGLVFDWRDAGRHALARLEGARIELCEVEGGKATVLATAALSPSASAPRRMRVTQRDGRVRAWVDGRQVAGAYRPEAGMGRVGLFADRRAASFGAVRLSAGQSPRPVKVHNRIFAGEDTMAAWASAGSDWQVSPEKGRTVAWHEIVHWGDCAVRYTFAQPSAVPGTLGFAVRADGKALDSGYRLVVEPRPDQPARLTLLAGERAVGTAAAPSVAVTTLELRWLGRCAAAFVDGERVLWHRASEAPGGQRVALWAEGWQPELASTSVGSANVVDEYFEAAPVEWRAESGEWLMQNRWTCSPQWSWYGGSSPQAATLWYKRAFRGDMAVHFFAAFQMKQRDSRIYRPMELNVTICADGRNLASGYTFIYGGWLNTRSALLKGETIVATTTKETLRPPTLLDTTPSTNFLHRKWWHIAIEKHGSTISCWVDDRLALQYDDPEPLEGGSACLWTYDNSVMIARAWLAYEEADGTALPLAEPVERPAFRAPPAVVSSHGARVHDFEGGTARWGSLPGSATVRLEPRGKGLALAVTNPRAGGSFELAFPIEPFDAMERPFLSFDYRMPPEVKANLHVKMNGREHAVLLADRRARVAGIPILGSIDHKPDDQWHSATIDLRALLLRCYPDATTLPVTALALGTRDRRHYLTAGFGGNYAGSTYRLDNVCLWRPGPPDAKLSWDEKLTVSYLLDREPGTVPDDQPEQGAAIEHKGLADGHWHFHLKARQADGSWSRVAHVPLAVDASPPRVAACSPAAGARSAAHTVTLDLADASGIVPKSLKVALLGKDYPVQVDPTSPTASYTPAPVTYDPVARRLAVDLAMLALSLKDGQAVGLKIASAKDFLGHAMEPYELTWAYDLGSDKQPPTHLRLEGSHLDLCRDDFETGLGEWAGHETYSLIERDDATAAAGRRSLRIHCTHSGGPFTVVARSSPFDAGKFPIVSFDYKMPSNVRVDLVLTVEGKAYTVRFTDPNGSNCIGAIPGVHADDQWHHTEFNLHEMLGAIPAQDGTHTISSLVFADTGFYGNADGVEYHIDNFVIAPAASTREKPIEWKLAACDPSGIAAVQYSLSNQPGAVEWQDAKQPAWQFKSLGAGLFHFHVRARDGAGNWSKPLHRVVLVDDKPPDIKTARPKAGGRAATSRITVALTDSPAGINRDRTVLTVAGKAYSAAHEGVVYDARTHSLTWDGTELAVPVTFANGQKVAVQLTAQDNVGNAATRQWDWTMDYKLDKAPPPAPYVTRVPVKVLSRSTFEKDTGTWAGYSKYGSVSRTSRTAATGRNALRIAATRTGSYFGAYAYKGSLTTSKYPILSFDYRIPPGVPMNLHVHVGGWKTIRLTSPTSTYAPIGRVPLEADDQWHHAEINLYQTLKAAGASTRVRYILFADWATRSARAGTCFYIDNFAIAAPANGQKLCFEWTAVKDPTGIAGYAFALDRSPGTQPTKLNGPALTAALANPGPGQWFFHLRARDGAGNWSPPAHVPIAIPTATAAAK